MSQNSHVPNHIGIIMDGNGRWAIEKGLPRAVGHKKGAEMVRVIVESAANVGVTSLTLFGFSIENWRRPKSEVSVLMNLAESYLLKEIKSLHKEGVCFQVIGNRQALPNSLQDRILEAEDQTRLNTRFYLNIALSYSGRWDIVNAVNQLKKAHPQDEITEDDFEGYLSLSDQEPLDLIIRTSGEQRISNFLLWQAAYSELYFTDTKWPDFDKSEFSKSLDFYQTRNRKFGGL